MLSKKELNFIEAQNDALKKQNKDLQQDNKELLHYLACMTEQRNKYKMVLFDIKERCAKHLKAEKFVTAQEVIDLIELEVKE